MSHSIDETYTIYKETFRKARKTHVCSACKTNILAGHYYCSVFIVFQGDTENLKRCGSCQKIHEHLRTLDPSVMWPNEKLDCNLDYKEEWDAEPPEAIAALPLLSDTERGKLLAP